MLKYQNVFSKLIILATYGTGLLYLALKFWNLLFHHLVQKENTFQPLAIKFITTCVV